MSEHSKIMINWARANNRNGATNSYMAIIKARMKGHALLSAHSSNALPLVPAFCIAICIKWRRSFWITMKKDNWKVWQQSCCPYSKSHFKKQTAWTDKVENSQADERPVFCVLFATQLLELLTTSKAEECFLLHCQWISLSERYLQDKWIFTVLRETTACRP